MRHTLKYLLLLVFLGSTLQAAPSYIQAANNGTTGGSNSPKVSITLANSPIVGNTVVVSCSVFTTASTDVITFTDNYSNTYTTISTFYNSSPSATLLVAIGYAHVNTTGASFAPTCHYTSNANAYITGTAAEYSGLATGSLVDGVISANSATNCGNLTTTNANDLLVFFDSGTSNDNTWSLTSPPSGFTVRTTVSQGLTYNTAAFADRVVSSAGTYATTFTTSTPDGSTCMAAGLKGAAPTTSITKVQSRSAEGANIQALSLGFSSNNTAGNTIIVISRMSYHSGDVIAMSDSNGNTYALASTAIQATDGHRVDIWYAKNINVGSNTVTVTDTTTVNLHPWLAIYEYSGLDTTHPLDKTANASGSGTAISTGATSPTTSANELVMVGIGEPATMTATLTVGSGFTLGESDTGNSSATVETAIVSTTGPQTGTATTSSTINWSAAIATFVAASTSSPPPITKVQSRTVDATSQNPVSLAFSSANTASNLIIVMVRMSYPTDVETITDSAGNVYSLAASAQQTVNGYKSDIWYAKNIKAGSNTVTFNDPTQVNAHVWLAIYEYSGLDLVNPLDRTSTATGTGTAISTGTTSSTTTANELVFVGIGQPTTTSSTITAGAGFTIADASSSLIAATETEIVSNTGPQTGTATASTSIGWSAAVATFAAASQFQFTNVVQESVSSSTGTQKVTATFGNAVTAGDTIVVFAVGSTGGGNLVMSDSLSNSYTYVTRYAPGTSQVAAWYSVGVIGGSDTITVQYPNATGFSGTLQVYIVEISGLSALDAWGTSNISSTSVSVSTSSSTVNTNETSLAFFTDWSHTPTWTFPTGQIGFAVPSGNGSQAALSYKSISTPGATSQTMTVNDANSHPSIILSFKGSQTVVQHGSGTVTANGVSLGLGSSVISGNVLISMAVSNGSTDGLHAVAISDSQSNVWTKISDFSPNTKRVTMWICTKPAAASTTVSLHYTNVSTSDYLNLNVFEVSNVIGVDSVSSVGTPSGVTTASISTSVAAQGELIFGYFTGGSTTSSPIWTPGSGYSILTPNAGNSSSRAVVEEKTTNTTGSVVANITSNVSDSIAGTQLALSSTVNNVTVLTIPVAAKIRQWISF